MTDGQVFCIGQKDTGQWIDISQSMKLDNAKDTVNRRKNKHGDSEVSSIIQQWQEDLIYSAKWANKKNEMQKKYSGEGRRPDYQSLYRDLGIKEKL